MHERSSGEARGMPSAASVGAPVRVYAVRHIPHVVAVEAAAVIRDRDI
jgi:hypothetical protein